MAPWLVADAGTSANSSRIAGHAARTCRRVVTGRRTRDVRLTGYGPVASLLPSRMGAPSVWAVAVGTRRRAVRPAR